MLHGCFSLCFLCGFYYAATSAIPRPRYTARAQRNPCGGRAASRRLCWGDGTAAVKVHGASGKTGTNCQVVMAPMDWAIRALQWRLQ